MLIFFLFFSFLCNSDASSPEKDTTLKAGLKSKNPHPEEDSGQLAAKRLKIDVNQEKEAASEENDSLCHNGSESSSESRDSSERSSEECKGESAHGTPSTLGALCTGKYHDFLQRCIQITMCLNVRYTLLKSHSNRPLIYFQSIRSGLLSMIKLILCIIKKTCVVF